MMASIQGDPPLKTVLFLMKQMKGQIGIEIFVRRVGGFRVAAACRGPKAERSRWRVAKVVPL